MTDSPDPKRFCSSPLGLDTRQLSENPLSHQEDQTCHQLPSRSGSSRQTTRLQRRNQGFRGGSLSLRRTTPPSLSSEPNISSLSGHHCSSDIENTPPFAARSRSQSGRRRLSGVLQDIGNSTISRSSRHKRRNPSDVLYSPDDGNRGHIGLNQSPSPKMTSRSVRMLNKASHRKRSYSTEANDYIAHLEAELASAQSQLSSATSPSITREKSSRIRTLNEETRQLREELSAWESRYQERVQENVDEHAAIEASLRQRLKSSEQAAEELRMRKQELELDVETTTYNLRAVEAANVTLEKRVEMMSELLAASKIDLYAGTPAGSRAHSRHKSMMPRFPTASSLISSPEHQPQHIQSRPTSPMLAFTSISARSPDSPRRTAASAISPLHSPPLLFQPNPTASDIMSDVDSVFSEAQIAEGDSMTSGPDNLDGPSGLNAWGFPAMPSVSNKNLRPMRRMRRFGAGSLGPKPLILPSASQSECFYPSSAPPLDRGERLPERASIAPSLLPRRPSDVGAAQGQRKRSFTVGYELFSASACLDGGASMGSPKTPLTGSGEESPAGTGEQSGGSVHSRSQSSSRDYYSPVGLTIGRNLMEELSAVKTTDSGESGYGYRNRHQKGRSDEDSGELPNQYNKQMTGEDDSLTTAVDIDVVKSLSSDLVQERDTTGFTTLAALPVKRRAIPQNLHRRMTSINHPLTSLYQPYDFIPRLRLLLTDFFWHSPVTLARHVVQVAQQRILIPVPLRNVQWWLVGVLLGPMARRRMLAERTSMHMRLRNADGLRLPLPTTPPSKSGCHSNPSSQGRIGSSASTCPGAVRDVCGTSPNNSNRSRPNTISPKLPNHHRYDGDSFGSKHSPWLWLKFSLTLAFAIGIAFVDGPGSLLRLSHPPRRADSSQERSHSLSGGKQPGVDKC